MYEPVVAAAALSDATADAQSRRQAMMCVAGGSSALAAARHSLCMQAMARDKSFYAEIACRDMKGNGGDAR
jgi:hypothetical protein